MSTSGPDPGPIADRTFDTGFRLAVLSGLVGIGLLYWFDVISPSMFTLLYIVLLFPLYLMFVLVVLGVWLGYETDETDLEPASEEVEMTTDSWKNWPW